MCFLTNLTFFQLLVVKIVEIMFKWWELMKRTINPIFIFGTQHKARSYLWLNSHISLQFLRKLSPQSQAGNAIKLSFHCFFLDLWWNPVQSSRFNTAVWSWKVSYLTIIIFFSLGFYPNLFRTMVGKQASLIPLISPHSFFTQRNKCYTCKGLYSCTLQWNETSCSPVEDKLRRN